MTRRRIHPAPQVWMALLNFASMSSLSAYCVPYLRSVPGSPACSDPDGSASLDGSFKTVGDAAAR